MIEIKKLTIKIIAIWERVKFNSFKASTITSATKQIPEINTIDHAIKAMAAKNKPILLIICFLEIIVASTI